VRRRPFFFMLAAVFLGLVVAGLVLGELGDIAFNGSML